MSLVLPWFETKKNEEAGILGKKIELKCSARGYPLDVEWRVSKKIAEDKTVTSCISKFRGTKTYTVNKSRSFSTESDRVNISSRALFPALNIRLMRLVMIRMRRCM